MLQNKNKIKVLFLVPYPKNSAPSQRLKFEQYFDYFEKNNIKITFCPFYTKKMYSYLYEKGHSFKKIFNVLARLLIRLKQVFSAINYDLVYLHLEASPLRVLFFEKLLVLLGKPIIYDIDDLIYLPKKRNLTRIVSFIFAKTPKKVNYLMTKSKYVIVCTNYLKSYSLKFNRNVINISSTINTDTYLPKKHTEKKQVCVGWSGSHSTAPYLKILAGVLKKLQKKYNIKIKVIGDSSFKIEGLNIEAKNWNEKTEIEDLKEIDIGLYPLPKDEWVFGKSGLKALQYMALGIPPVCSAIGTNFEIISDGKDGFLARSDKEWFEKISLLIENKELRKKIGIEARKKVEKKYSVKVNAPRYLNVIKEVYSERFN